MASSKNTARNKRKYGDKQQTRTATNKANKQARHERRIARALARAEALVGRTVKMGKQQGTVLAVVDRPADVKRPGNYLTITGEDSKVYVRPRSSIKPL